MAKANLCGLLHFTMRVRSSIFTYIHPFTYANPLTLAQLVNKSSDVDVIFGSARGLNYKLQCWDDSRIAWLAELERRHEVYRRRQKRAQLRKLKEQAAQSRLGQCSFWCHRLRSWFAKWNR